MDFNHSELVQQSLVGERAIDEQTLTSIAVLSDRLERLKKMGDQFKGITFSPNIRKVIRRKEKSAAVC
jgi:hypothetical protein